MNTSHIGKVCDLRPVEKIRLLISFRFVSADGLSISESISSFGKAMYLTEFTYDRLTPEGTHSAKQRGMRISISFENIINDFIAFFP